MGNTLDYYVFKPDVTPHSETPIETDPLAGFAPGARKPKVFPVSAAEIESVQVPPEFQDYCLHKNLEWKSCQADNFPFVRRCAHYLHHYYACMYEEHLDRMRDYERERRILVRKQKRKQQQEKMQKQAELSTA